MASRMILRGLGLMSRPTSCFGLLSVLLVLLWDRLSFNGFDMETQSGGRTPFRGHASPLYTQGF
jgi:hypothetical protein